MLGKRLEYFISRCLAQRRNLAGEQQMHDTFSQVSTPLNATNKGAKP